MAGPLVSAAAMRVLRAGSLASFILVLAGCGFHLQGNSPLPEGIDAMDVTYSDDYRAGEPPLVTDLRQRLRERGVLGESDAPARLHIRNVENQQAILTVSPVDGRVSEYELTARAVFDYSVNGADQLSGQQMSITRDYSFNDTERLAAEAEQRDLLESMQQELANLILLRIAEINGRLAPLQSRSS